AVRRRRRSAGGGALRTLSRGGDPRQSGRLALGAQQVEISAAGPYGRRRPATAATARAEGRCTDAVTRIDGRVRRRHRTALEKRAFVAICRQSPLRWFGAKRGAAGADFGGFVLALRRRKSYNPFSPLHTFLPAQSHDKGVGRLKQTKATRCSGVAL